MRPYQGEWILINVFIIYAAETAAFHWLMSQCHPGYWSRVLGLEWIDILTNNFRQHERLSI